MLKKFTARLLQRLERVQRHTNPQWIDKKLDEKQRTSQAGVLYLLWKQYPLYWVMRLLGFQSLYWRIHRRLYMALHYGET